MSHYITGLDNVGTICEAKPEHFKRLEEDIGFTLYPLGRQGIKMGGIFIPAGTGSRAVNFRRGGYYELISIYNQWLPTGGYKKLLKEKGERLVKFTMNLSNADGEAKRLAALGKPAYGPMEFRRVFTSATKGKQDARFSILVYPFPSDYPVAVAGTKHLTPDVTWQDDLLDHRNGAVLLSNALLAVEDLDRDTETYEQIFQRSLESDRKTRVFRFQNGSRLTFVALPDLDYEIPGAKPDTSPFLAAVYFGVEDLGKVKALFHEKGVPYEERDGRLVVPSSYMFNSTYVFEEVESATA